LNLLTRFSPFGIYEKHDRSHESRKKDCHHDNPKRYSYVFFALPIGLARKQNLSKKVQWHFLVVS